jgi:putative component of membrane protein insertase Oxa1/YidC/SpoIIIJ protein YidD
MVECLHQILRRPATGRGNKNIFKQMKKARIKIGLAVCFLFFGLALADTFRQPENQITARVYIGMVHIYQALGRPLLEGIVACRYRPTCSDYSIQAVEKHGLRYGLVLTWIRLNNCTSDKPMGLIDEVPE